MTSRRQIGQMALWITVALAGCVSDPGAGRPLGRSDYGSGSFALENSSKEDGILRMGDALRMYSAPGDMDLLPGHKYHFEVTNVSGEAPVQVSEGDVNTREDGSIPPTTLAHDLGDMPDATEGAGDELKVDFWDPETASDHLEAFIPLSRVPALQGGWNLQEVQPPHVFATDSNSLATNAFAVSDNGDVDPGEVAGPVYVGGEGLPDVQVGGTVDVYVMRDQDEWQGFPIAGAEGRVAGPVPVTVNADGTLAHTMIWEPTLNDVGIYDVVVDVDGNGIFDYDFSNKDGADGEAKVGITIQYSQAWVRARRIRHIIMNIAFNDPNRGGQWTNQFAAAQDLYLYVNPDVTTRPDLNHKWVYKWVVEHQDFEEYWNNPLNEDADGCIDFSQNILGNFQVPPQRGCTNSAPLHVGRADNIAGTGNGPGEYDVVFTFDTQDGADPRYCPGTDILDIVSSDATEVLVQDIANVPLEQRVGFTVQ